jgi:rhamnulokinase
VRNRALCQLTADMTGVPVIAGPGEATAIGNILVQARAVGEVASLEQMRELVAASFTTERYEPTADDSASQTYERFLSLTGLRVSTCEPSLA